MRIFVAACLAMLAAGPAFADSELERHVPVYTQCHTTIELNGAVDAQGGIVRRAGSNRVGYVAVMGAGNQALCRQLLERCAGSMAFLGGVYYRELPERVDPPYRRCH